MNLLEAIEWFYHYTFCVVFGPYPNSGPDINVIKALESFTSNKDVQEILGLLEDGDFGSPKRIEEVREIIRASLNGA